MSDHLLVATRKGLFGFRRGAGGRWRNDETAFLGEPVNLVLADARDGNCYAALNLGHFGVKLHRRRPGQDWQECAVPVYPPQPDAGGGAPEDKASVAWTLQQIWALEAGGADQPGALWAGTIPGGLFRSDDCGDSWTLVRSLWDRPERAEWFGGGYDAAGIHSVCVDPRDSGHVTLAVSCGGVWQTRDGGANWACTTAGMRADYMPPERAEDPVIQDPHRMVSCRDAPDALWVQHHNGIFRSVDGGMAWEAREAQPSSFGFAVAVHPADPHTAWFVPAIKDACRVPVEGRFVVTRTRDGGATFQALSRGLPEGPAYDLVYRHGLDVDASGNRLAMGSTTGGLWLTEDGGDEWTCISTHLPPILALRFA